MVEADPSTASRNALQISGRFSVAAMTRKALDRRRSALSAAWEQVRSSSVEAVCGFIERMHPKSAEAEDGGA